MISVINSERVPIKLWLTDIEEGALEQAKNLANLPFVFKHIALMPDTHRGYGMPIGAIIATTDVIIPHAVGSDISCGVCAIRTNLENIELDTLKKIMSDIRKTIPVGIKRHKEQQSNELMPQPDYEVPISFREYQNARVQLGTLGGGNHFIEFQKGSDGFIWVMVHSGSRNLGYQVADHYNKLAIELNEKWYSSVKKETQLAFLPFDSEEGKSYFREMKYCGEFAKSNRSVMITRIQEAITNHVQNVSFSKLIDIAHNYAAIENHFKKNVIVHRKGATSAKLGELGLIPGSQGTKSYVVSGLGNDLSFRSCSHGAGRKLSRTKAQSDLSLDVEKSKLDDLGILHSIRSIKDLDEASGAYKDIDTVINNQLDLIEVKVELTPLAVIKG